MSIPLNIDWLTLTWLKTRAACWWRRTRLHPLALALLVLGVFSGCVPVTRFEETQSAAQVEMEGRRRVEYQTVQLKAEIAQLRAQLAQQGQTIEQREEALSQAQLDSTTLGKQREDAEGMVEQLRGELARVGGHLSSFHDENQKLEAARDAEAARGRALARLARDAALSLAEPIATGEYSLDAEAGHLVLGVPRETLLAEDGAVKPDAEALLKAVTRLLELHPQAKLRLEDGSAQADPVAVSRLLTALGERGVAAERIEPLAVDAAATTAASPGQISFGFSVP